MEREVSSGENVASVVIVRREAGGAVHVMEHPTLFTAQMVRALLEDRKTQTRRLITPRNSMFNGGPWPKWAKVGEECGHFDWVAATVDKGPSPAGNPGPYIHLPYTGTDTDWQDTRHRIYPRVQPGDRLWVKETHQYADWTEDGMPLIRYQADAATRWIEAEPPADWGEKLTNIWAALSDPENYNIDGKGTDRRWRPSISMPRWASRITLHVAAVRVEQLHAITEADALSEGVEAQPFPGPGWQGYQDMGGGRLLYTQALGDSPPDWMIDPKRMPHETHLDRSSKDMFRSLWESINGARSWESNPLVWVYEFKRVKP